MAKANRTGVPVTIYFPPRLREAFRELCKLTERSLNTEMLRAARLHLEAEGIPYDGEPEPEPQRRKLKAKARGNK